MINMKMTLQELSQRLNIPEYWFITLFTIESGNKPDAVNKKTNAVGLIQFLTDTAINLGTTTSRLKLMTYDQQLWYVYLYIRPYASKIKSFTDLYLSVFFPAAIRENNDYAFETKRISASKIAQQNPLFDLNKNSKITKAEVEYYLQTKYPKCYNVLK